MKRLPFLVLCVGLFVQAADLTDTMNTPSSRQLYNQSYRDTKDGNNAQTTDSVSANSYATVTGVQTLVKSSGGYLDNITLLSACNGTTTYIIADASAAAGVYATVISTIGVNTAFVNIPYHIRFNNGLAINVYSSTCPVMVSYR
jgi:hypothetical protein